MIDRHWLRIEGRSKLADGELFNTDVVRESNRALELEENKLHATQERNDTTTSEQGEAAQMQAIVQAQYGSADVLELRTIERPEVTAKEVLIEVYAAGVDRGVWHLMTGLPYFVRLAGFGVTRPKNPVLGLDIAGRVIEVGADVTRFVPGDEVFGIGKGSFAEYATAEETKLAKMPLNVSFEQAAVSAVSGITALEALTDVGDLQSGQRVLIVGASGGVGAFAVQIAKSLGSHVTGVCGQGMIDRVRELGATEVFDYTREDFVDGEGNYDLILDIGGRNSLSRLRSVLAPKGTPVIVEVRAVTASPGELAARCERWCSHRSPVSALASRTFRPQCSISRRQSPAEGRSLSCVRTNAWRSVAELRPGVGEFAATTLIRCQQPHCETES